MKHTLRAALVGAAITATVGLASPAHADASSFLVDVTNLGFYNGNGANAELNVGYDVCHDLDSGQTPNQVIRSYWLETGIPTLSEADQFVGIAARDLCPWHFGQGYNVSLPYPPMALTGPDQSRNA